MLFSNLGAALNYVFQGMMARGLSAADFGLMNSLFALSGFLALPFTIYANMLARPWAEMTNASRGAETDRLWYALLVAATLALGIAAALVVPFLPCLAWWFKTTNHTALLITLLGTGGGTVLGLAAPILTARQWFGALAVGGLAGAVIRLGLGWLGIHWGVPLSGAIAATSLGAGGTAIFAFRRLRWPGWRDLPFRSLLPHAGEWTAPALSATALFLLCGADMLVVRRVYAPEAAGLFAQVMVLARIIFFLVGPMTAVIFPKTATSHLDSASANETRVVRRALALGALILFPAAFILSLAAPTALQWLRGDADPAMIWHLRVAVWCLVPLSLGQLVIPSFFARRQERLLLEFTLLAALLPLGIALFHQRLLHAFLVEGAVGILLLAFVTARWALRRET